IQHAADVLFARYERAFVDAERAEVPRVDLHLFSVTCRALALMGYAEDPRLLAAAECVARLRIAETELDAAVPLRVRLTRDLLFLGALPEGSRSALVRRGIDFLVERAAATELPIARERKRDEEAFGFPAADAPDLLELLEALARVGTPRRREVEGALAL